MPPGEASPGGMGRLAGEFAVPPAS